jgi:hypothetical protein
MDWRCFALCFRRHHHGELLASGRTLLFARDLLESYLSGFIQLNGATLALTQVLLSRSA